MDTNQVKTGKGILDMKTLHEKFLRSGLTKRLTIAEASQQLMENYQATAIGNDAVEELQADPCVNFNHITHCFSIPEEVVDRLRSDSEKASAEEVIRLISQYGSLSAKEKERAINGEKIIIIVLESSDQRYIDNFTIQGECEKLLKELIYLQGMDPADYTLENEKYRIYLKVLQEKGYI